MCVMCVSVCVCIIYDDNNNNIIRPDAFSIQFTLRTCLKRYVRRYGETRILFSIYFFFFLRLTTYETSQSLINIFYFFFSYSRTRAKVAAVKKLNFKHGKTP